MKIGLVKEIKAQEKRVGLTPDGVRSLSRAGHMVLVERDAGVGSGFSNSEYQTAGAVLVDRPDVFSDAQLIIKVKEPLPEEYDLIRPGQTLFTYLHLAPARELTQALLARGVIGIAYETIQRANGSLPLLTPMSQVAGRMSIQVGAQFLEWFYGGSGVLLGGVPGVAPAHVVIIGAGIVGLNALEMAVGMGARVTVFDVSVDKLNQVNDMYGGRVTTLISHEENLSQVVPTADLLIGAVLIPGAKAPKLVGENLVRQMQDGSVIVDVAIDQGGIVETSDHTTTHQDPVYVRHGVVHYAVANMPGAVPRTSTLALTNVTLPFVHRIAAGSFRDIVQDPVLSSGVNLYQGHVTNQRVAESLAMPYEPLMQVV